MSARTPEPRLTRPSAGVLLALLASVCLLVQQFRLPLHLALHEHCFAQGGSHGHVGEHSHHHDGQAHGHGHGHAHTHGHAHDHARAGGERRVHEHGGGEGVHHLEDHLDELVPVVWFKLSLDVAPALVPTAVSVVPIRGAGRLLDPGRDRAPPPSTLRSHAPPRAPPACS